MKSPLEAQRELRREHAEQGRKAASQLAHAYPQIQQIRLDLTFADSISEAPAPQSHLMYPPARAFFQYPCPHADCSGHLDLDEIVMSALRTTKRNIQGELVCPGVRPQRGATSRHCGLRVHYQMTTLYR